MRDNKRIIYTSDNDRGLQHLLEMWPEVRKAVPDATLHCFYGWQLFDMAYKDNPASMMWKDKIMELCKQEGITYEGRVSQTQIKEEYLKSGIWAYPAHFGEINCISAIKAQAYGCEPVVVNYAALQETVQFGRKVSGDIYDQETKDEYLKQLIEALKNPMSEEDREKMSKWAKDKYSWSKIAHSWVEEFKK